MSRKVYLGDVGNEMCCSFCRRKAPEVKLISSPSDYPRAYICDQCIAVCTSILDDEEGERERDLWRELLDALRTWLERESEGADASSELDAVRRLATSILTGRPEPGSPPSLS
jgi:hypothetical protein